MSNKTISINPTLFSIGGIKTKKNREKKVAPKPLINPNVLKNKLLNRIKEHKKRETQDMDKRPDIVDKNNNKGSEIHVKTETFSDEFNDSINYLQTLSKQKKVNDEKTKYEKQKQKRKEALERKTLKSYQQTTNFPQSYNLACSNMSQIQQQPNHQLPLVNIDLPEELKIEETMFQIHPNTTPVILNKNKNVVDTVPYGILKGGTKPTYRVWCKTQRNNVETNPSTALTIQGANLSKEKIEREARLHSLREKLKQKEVENSSKQIIGNEIKLDELMVTENLIKPSIVPSIVPSILTTSSEILPTTNTEPLKNEQIIATKKITKKTIKKKYTLGKSKIKKIVGVLIKDRRTRKQVLSAQKDLKRKQMNDVKSYLRDHNLLKVGSNAPNDVIRKLYESAMLAGEVTNSNSETLLHNFSKEHKQL